jgi:hypothetical protein
MIKGVGFLHDIIGFPVFIVEVWNNKYWRLFWRLCGSKAVVMKTDSSLKSGSKNLSVGNVVFRFVPPYS